MLHEGKKTYFALKIICLQSQWLKHKLLNFTVAFMHLGFHRKRSIGMRNLKPHIIKERQIILFIQQISASRNTSFPHHQNKYVIFTLYSVCCPRHGSGMCSGPLFLRNGSNAQKSFTLLNMTNKNSPKLSVLGSRVQCFLECEHIILKREGLCLSKQFHVCQQIQVGL